MKSVNPVVLSYHETLLRHSDIELLRGPHWLNDTILSFYFEYLEINRFPKQTQLLFVPPQVTQCVKITPVQEIGVFLSPLANNNKEFIFFALNDNQQTEFSGGTHWSLLVFSHPEKQCFHFDSFSGANRQQALELSDKLMRYFKVSSGYGSCTEVDCIQQSNGYDCGIYVLCHAENLAHYATTRRKIFGCPKLEVDIVQAKRSYILDLIHTLR